MGLHSFWGTLTIIIKQNCKQLGGPGHNWNPTALRLKFVSIPFQHCIFDESQIIFSGKEPNFLVDLRVRTWAQSRAGLSIGCSFINIVRVL